MPNKEVNWEEYDEEELKKLLGELKKKPDSLKPTRIKDVEVMPNKLVKTIITVESLEPAVNIIKAWKAKCPECESEKNVYNPWLLYCKDIFKDKACKLIGPKGGTKDVPVDKEPINDTGYITLAFDPEDNGGNPATIKVFFSNKILPQSKSERDYFESQIQSCKVEITGIIRTKQSKEKNVSDWYIDTQEYKVIETKYNPDEKKLHLIGENVKRDDDFFKEKFLPRTYGLPLIKKVHAIFTCSPHRIKFPDGEIKSSTIRIAEFGDQGQNKTQTSLQNLEYFRGTQTQLISAENSNNRGLLIKNTKSASTGKWVAQMGIIPKNNNGAVYLDGYGSQGPEEQKQLRGVEEEDTLKQSKAGGNIDRPCFVHLCFLGNLLKPVAEYPTKHKASFDLAATISDGPNRFYGPDRRRKDWILILANNDTNASEIDKHLYLNKKSDFDHVSYWNNLREFAWSLKPEQIIWGEDVGILAIEKVDVLRQRYRDYDLDYGILGKGGSKIFIKQLPAVAIIHESIDSNLNVIVTKEHVEWLYELYLEHFRELGLDTETGQREFYEAHAKKIIASCNPLVIKILQNLNKYGSQSAIEKAGVMSRMSIYRELRNVLGYKIQYETEEGQSETENCYYSFLEGSCDAELKETQNKSWYEIVDVDGLLEPLCKKDGTLTKFGRILIKEAVKEPNFEQFKKIKGGVTPVTLDTP